MSLALQQLRSAGVQLLASSDSGAIPGHGVKTIWAYPFQLEPWKKWCMMRITIKLVTSWYIWYSVGRLEGRQRQKNELRSFSRKSSAVPHAFFELSNFQAFHMMRWLEASRSWQAWQGEKWPRCSVYPWLFQLQIDRTRTEPWACASMFWKYCIWISPFQRILPYHSPR